MTRKLWIEHRDGAMWLPGKTALFNEAGKTGWEVDVVVDEMPDRIHFRFPRNTGVVMEREGDSFASYIDNDDRSYHRCVECGFSKILGILVDDSAFLCESCRDRQIETGIVDARFRTAVQIHKAIPKLSYARMSIYGVLPMALVIVKAAEVVRDFPDLVPSGADAVGLTMWDVLDTILGDMDIKDCDYEELFRKAREIPVSRDYDVRSVVRYRSLMRKVLWKIYNDNQRAKMDAYGERSRYFPHDNAYKVTVNVLFAGTPKMGNFGKFRLVKGYVETEDGIHVISSFIGERHPLFSRYMKFGDRLIVDFRVKKREMYRGSSETNVRITNVYDDV